jgi:hypothetical protein
MKTSFILLAIATTVASAAPKKKAPKAAAKDHMAKAAAASQDGRNEDALRELDAAWALDPQPMLLLARGHLYVKLEQCEPAIKLYEEFIATGPAQDLADAANEAIASCKATLAPPPVAEPPKPVQVSAEEMNLDQENPNSPGAKQAPPPEPEPTVTGAPTTSVVVDAPPRGVWFKDPIVIGLGAGGVIGIGAGLVLYTAARGKVSDAEAASFYEQWRVANDDAHTLRRYAVIGGVAGVLLAGGAVLYYVSTYTGEKARRVTLVPTQRGGVIGWTGSF